MPAGRVCRRPARWRRRTRSPTGSATGPGSAPIGPGCCGPWACSRSPSSRCSSSPRPAPCGVRCRLIPSWRGPRRSGRMLRTARPRAAPTTAVSPDGTERTDDLFRPPGPRRHPGRPRRLAGDQRVGGRGGLEPRAVRRARLLRPGPRGLLPRPDRRGAGLGHLRRQLRRGLRLPRLLPRPPRPARPRPRPHHLEDRPGPRREPHRGPGRSRRPAGQLPPVRLPARLPHHPVRRHRPRGRRTRGRPPGHPRRPGRDHRLRRRLPPRRPAPLPRPVAHRPRPPRLRPPRRRTPHRLRRPAPRPRRPARRPAPRRHHRGRPRPVRRADRRGRGPGTRHRRPRTQRRRHRPRRGGRSRPVLRDGPHVHRPGPPARPGTGVRRDHPRTGLNRNSVAAPASA
ncbi:exported hypothetical protein [Streptomyces misionensis JCM 4497]